MNRHEEEHYVSITIGALIGCIALAVGLALAMGWMQ